MVGDLVLKVGRDMVVIVRVDRTSLLEMVAVGIGLFEEYLWCEKATVHYLQDEVLQESAKPITKRKWLAWHPICT